jgi:ribonucleoside-diphosphate reductase alpha chain
MSENTEYETINVITRSGELKPLSSDKISHRIIELVKKNPKIPNINVSELTQRVFASICNLMTTHAIDELIADLCASLSSSHSPNHMTLASRFVISNHHKFTLNTFFDKMKIAYTKGLLDPEFFEFVEKHSSVLDKMINYEDDYKIDYFGFRTFQKLYGIKVDGKLIERVQDMFLRVAVALHFNTTESHEKDLFYIQELYSAFSNKLLIHGTPTLSNAGLRRGQYASCFLLACDDSSESILKMNNDAGQVSKYGGGVGMCYSNVRCKGSEIKGINSVAGGPCPFIQINNATARAMTQGRRKGSFAVYMSIIHADIFQFLGMMLKSVGDETTKARDMFYGVWVPNLYYERLIKKENISLFDPKIANKLIYLYDQEGDEAFTKEYLKLESEGKYVEQVSVKKINDALFLANKESGTPYIVNHDTVNAHNMQANIGSVTQSNLCAEIVEATTPQESAVCNLASISLTECVEDKDGDNHEFPKNPFFNFQKLIKIVKIATRNLNNIIDKSFYPTPETETSNLRHRPIGIGVQGYADAMLKMRYPFESNEARELNKKIFETMYYASLSGSCELSRELYLNSVRVCKSEGVVEIPDYSGPVFDRTETATYIDHETIPKDAFAYSTYNASLQIHPVTKKPREESYYKKGILHIDLYKRELATKNMLDWDTLREKIKVFGVRNSLFIALMPTASTSQFLGNNECIEPFTANMYKRSTLAGEFVIFNKYLIHDLQELYADSGKPDSGKPNFSWNKISNYIIALNGSIQNIEGIPQSIKELYKTAFEMDPFVLIKIAGERQHAVDQSQSFNWFTVNIDKKLFNQMMVSAWRAGLKTSKYYTRDINYDVGAIKFTLDHHLVDNLQKKKQPRTDDIKEEEKICDACGS